MKLLANLSSCKHNNKRTAIHNSFDIELQFKWQHIVLTIFFIFFVTFHPHHFMAFGVLIKSVKESPVFYL